MVLDRLSALFRQVSFQVLEDSKADMPRLRVMPDNDDILVSFCRTTAPERDSGCDVSLDFGSKDNPLLLALPKELHVAFRPADAGYPVAQLIVQETTQARCGSPAVLNRMFEVLLILLLRRVIESGQEMTGLLAGLADSHVKYALVAVHESPGDNWSTEKLAELSHLSRTAFYQRFNKCMGVAPMQYVRRWRLSLAKSKLAQGERINKVALSLGYQSTEGFSRAFHKHFQQWPGEIQKVETLN
jgi:AraC-like DNA-binding protein